MGNDDIITSSVIKSGFLHFAIPPGVDRISDIVGDVYSRVKSGFASKRVAPKTKARGQSPRDGRPSRGQSVDFGASIRIYARVIAIYS
jgi:hypothetical protein